MNLQIERKADRTMSIASVSSNYNQIFSLSTNQKVPQQQLLLKAPGKSFSQSIISFNGVIKAKKLFKFFPEITPYKTQQLQVSKIHSIKVAEYGNPKGKPAIFLHGGPGCGTSDDDARLFNPKTYHIVLIDQRGAGKSTPYACLKGNTTANLVADIEKVRKHLKIDKWLVAGQSWGTTLSLAYAEKHPDKVSGLVLQGIFMARPEEIKWIYKEGASRLFPEYWDKFIEPVPVEKRKNLVKAYKELLTSPDENIRREAAGSWNSWEGSLMKKNPDPKYIEKFGDPALALLECIYTLKRYFLKPNQLIKNADKIKEIPTWLIQGKCDWDCPPKSARDLHKVLPNSKLMEVPESGHSFTEPGIESAYIQATEEYKSLQEDPKFNYLG